MCITTSAKELYTTPTFCADPLTKPYPETEEPNEPRTEEECGTEVVTEPCPEPVEIHFEGCQDALEFNAGDVVLESLGRILQIDVTLKNICPHKRVALAVVLTEVDEKGKEFERGLKTLLIPAHDKQGCRDITVRCIKFVLPEVLDTNGGADAICDRRNFKARFIANYVDNDFRCCGQLT